MASASPMLPLVPQRVGQHVGVQNQREADSRKSIHRPRPERSEDLAKNRIKIQMKQRLSLCWSI